MEGEAEGARPRRPSVRARVPSCVCACPRVCARQCRAWPKRRREPRRRGPGGERPAPSTQSWKGALCPQGFCKRQVLRRRARVILPNSAKCPLIRTWLESGAGGVTHSTCSQGGDFAVRISPRTGGNGWKHFWVSRLWDLYWPLVAGGQACRQMPCEAQDAPSKEAPSPRHPRPPHGGALRWRRPSQGTGRTALQRPNAKISTRVPLRDGVAEEHIKITNLYQKN